MTEPFLKALDLHLPFGQTPALRGATLVAERGEFVAIMGPSGSGKSTLLHCLAGIYVPDSGEVHYGNERVDRMSDKQRTRLRRTEFGFVFQFGQLVPELSAEDNVAVPLLLNRVSRKEAYRQAHSWLARLGLSELAARHSGELSGGQAQRVAIARALVLQPKVLFADEPTGSLDSESGRQVLDLLTGIARAEGSTVLLVTHDAGVADYADRTVHVGDGTVTAAVPVGGA